MRNYSPFFSLQLANILNFCTNFANFINFIQIKNKVITSYELFVCIGFEKVIVLFNLISRQMKKKKKINKFLNFT